MSQKKYIFSVAVNDREITKDVYNYGDLLEFLYEFLNEKADYNIQESPFYEYCREIITLKNLLLEKRQQLQSLIKNDYKKRCQYNENSYEDGYQFIVKNAYKEWCQSVSNYEHSYEDYYHCLFEKDYEEWFSEFLPTCGLISSKNNIEKYDIKCKFLENIIKNCGLDLHKGNFDCGVGINKNFWLAPFGKTDVAVSKCYELWNQKDFSKYYIELLLETVQRLEEQVGVKGKERVGKIKKLLGDVDYNLLMLIKNKNEDNYGKNFLSFLSEELLNCLDNNKVSKKVLYDALYYNLLSEERLSKVRKVLGNVEYSSLSISIEDKGNHGKNFLDFLSKKELNLLDSNKIDKKSLHNILQKNIHNNNLYGKGNKVPKKTVIASGRLVCKANQCLQYVEKVSGIHDDKVRVYTDQYTKAYDVSKTGAHKCSNVKNIHSKDNKILKEKVATNQHTKSVCENHYSEKVRKIKIGSYIVGCCAFLSLGVAFPVVAKKISFMDSKIVIALTCISMIAGLAFMTMAISESCRFSKIKTPNASTKLSEAEVGAVSICHNNQTLVYS